MPYCSPLDGDAHASVGAINEAIRCLMSRPADQTRAEQYQELLVEWAAACRLGAVCWTTSA
ncbi:hypothetical protein GTY54_07505 [Streptomyces sp. SID625]|nr:hypothetical protein [Streptomyces sp. SID625]